jgi:hypothetical protein
MEYPLEREIIADAAAAVRDDSAPELYRHIGLPIVVGRSVGNDAIQVLREASQPPETVENIWAIIIARTTLEMLGLTVTIDTTRTA